MKKGTVCLIAITAAFLCVLLGLFVGRQTPDNRISLYHSDNIVEDATNSQSGLIDINTATKSELELLPGIGPALAQRIIDYRTENGPFAKTEDICNVSGIGSKTYEGLAQYITVGGNYEDTGS